MKSAFNENVMSISHRGTAFQSIFAETRQNLKLLLGVPDNFDIYFLSSANEIWERIIQNLVANHSHHFVNGSFSEKFFQFSQDYKKNSTKHNVDYGQDFTDFVIPESAELISVTLNETSIGYGFDLSKLKELRTNYPDKLIALDGVSAFPSVPLDFNLIDTAYFSIQKCFGLPSGLGVWIVNQKCFNKNESLKKANIITGSYHDLNELKLMGDKNQTPETPNTLAIYLLGKVAGDMLNRGVKSIHNDTIYKASILYDALDKSKTLSPFISTKVNRSKTIIVANCAQGNKELLQKMDAKGWVVGKGYGKFNDDHIRIANFPTHSKEIIEQMADFIAQET
jgi:phosphoserine aminotransferase